MMVAAAAMLSATAGASSPFTEFESGQVRPLAMSPDGTKLFAVNTPDNRVEVYKVKSKDLTWLYSVPVGLEPVALAARTNTEVWVVNHLSDSISIVDLSVANAPRVIRTLLVGDEPRDIVFAGPGRTRAFITTAHRGQNSPIDPQINTPGVGRADVWVFDATNLGSSLGGTPLNIVTLFSDTPRSLAVTPDGNTVYAAGFLSGNQTSIVGELQYPDFVPGTDPPYPLRVPPLDDSSHEQQPKVGIMVKYKLGTDNQFHWIDTVGNIWDWYFMFRLPDKDVFAIDATGNPPMQKPDPNGFFAHVGTVLYNMAVNPVSGKVYVSNTDARNDHRFEGSGVYASQFGFDTVRGHNSENRITVIDPVSGSVTPRHLNKHINYAACCSDNPSENAKSLAIPTGMTVSSDGQTLYVAALGSSKVGIFNTTQLENDTFTPDTNNQVALTGGGPTGLLLDEAHGQLFVLTRFDNSVKLVDTSTRQQVKSFTMYNPEPALVTNGRRFLYDAAHTSTHGDQACATCHVFGDFDGLTWDLGDPDGANFVNNNPRVSSRGDGSNEPFGPSLTGQFATMKGPMNTQSLRGLSNHGPMHWRGDRTGASDPGNGVVEPNAQPDSGAFNEHLAFFKFNKAFKGLIGRSAELPDSEMNAYADFILQVTYPPNPFRNLDNSLTASQTEGRARYMGPVEFAGNGQSNNACNSCHKLDPDGNSQYGVQFPGFFGTDGLTVKVPFPQDFKVPHFRNLYQKVGAFGNVNQPLPIFGPNGPLIPIFDQIPGQEGFLGDQIRGFGFSRAGDIDSALRFISNFAFDTRSPFGPNPPMIGNNPQGFPSNPDGSTNAEGLRQKKTVIDFLMAFDTNLKPIVGQQITLTPTTSGAVGSRIALLIDRGDHGDCDLVAKAFVDGSTRGYFYQGSGIFLTDRPSHGQYITAAALQALGTAQTNNSVTYTCVPPGSGLRIGVDRDQDGIFDGDDPTPNGG
jgi:DNA-binding beta-propeller fold protein YncE